MFVFVWICVFVCVRVCLCVGVVSQLWMYKRNQALSPTTDPYLAWVLTCVLPVKVARIDGVSVCTFVFAFVSVCRCVSVVDCLCMRVISQSCVLLSTWVMCLDLFVCPSLSDYLCWARIKRASLHSFAQLETQGHLTVTYVVVSR